MLLNKLKDNINKKLPISWTWKCNYCNNLWRMNLMGISDVKDEYDMKICRPDIALFDNNGRVSVVIEIVVTHKPEDTALNYYKENNITLIQVMLHSEDDFEMIEKNTIFAAAFDFCFNENCTHFSGIKARVNTFNKYYARRFRRPRRF